MNHNLLVCQAQCIFDLYSQPHTDYTDFMNKNLIIVAIVCLVIGATVGYYFGYDIGWERAVEQLQ